MPNVICQCGKTFNARNADIKRGWGKFCSKSCKAKNQAKLTGITGPHYKASGMTVNQMKKGKFAKSNFIKRSNIHLDEYGFNKTCHCGEEATIFVQSGFAHDGWEGMCEWHFDDTHPFDSSNFNGE